MAKYNGPKRNPGIMAGFDKAALRRHVEDADQRRAPTQEELAAAYGTDSDVIADARDFPASIDDVIEGICAQDQRFLEQGKKLLKQYLRNVVKGEPDAGKKARTTGARRSDTASSTGRPGASGVAANSSSHAAAPQRPDAAAEVPLFPADDYDSADIYGG